MTPVQGMTAYTSSNTRVLPKGKADPNAVKNIVSRKLPTPVEMVGVNNSFGESGTPAQLMEKYGLNARSIVSKVHAAIKRKELIENLI